MNTIALRLNWIGIGMYRIDFLDSKTIFKKSFDPSFCVGLLVELFCKIRGM